MSTIAYRDGVIAADTLVTWNGRRESYARKVHRFGPLLAGAAGSASMAAAFFDWLRAGAQGEPPKAPNLDKEYKLDAFVVMPDGLIVQFSEEASFASRAAFYAVGSGAALALGAMEAGASAAEAVEIAARLDINTGGEITALCREPLMDDVWHWREAWIDGIYGRDGKGRNGIWQYITR